MQGNEMYEQLFAIADGRIADTEAALAGVDVEQAATLVLTEVADRTRFFDGPAQPVTVQLDLGLPDRRLGYQLTVGGGLAALVPGWADEPVARIRQDLAELLRAVYGPPGVQHDATREVWIDDTGRPAEFTAEDPWIVRWTSAVSALGQVVRACGEFQPGLTDLALRFGSDKWGGHEYTQHYARHFAPYRQQRVKVLEIGVGGYQASDMGGASLKMWKHYFHRGLITGLDVFDKSGVDEARLSTVVGDQSDRDFLIDLYKQIGPLDIVVDDGSHESEHIIASFTALFPLMRPGGMYVIEDLQTSYWPGYNGGSTDPGDPSTAMGFLKTLLDGMHHQDQIRDSAYQPSEIEIGVTAIHLYHNLVFIEKGVNTEPTAPAWLPRSSTING